MDYRALRNIIDAHPEWMALSDAEVAAACNALTETRLKPGGAWVRVRTLYGNGIWTPTEIETMMGRLAVVAEGNPVVARVLGWINSVGEGTGIDVAATATRVQIQALQQAGALTETEATRLLAMGEETAAVFPSGVQPGDVRIARELD